MSLRADLLADARASRQLAAAEHALEVGAWAERNLILPRGDGPVAYRDAFTPYWRHWHALAAQRLDLATGASTERITLVCGTQIGKTFGFVVPLLAWIAATRPRDAALIMPGHEAIRELARQKLQPVFERSPRLAHLLPRGHAERQKRLSLRGWLLDRCTFFWLNGCVAMQLKSRDVPVLFADEFDLLPVDVEGSGSPIGLMRDRQKTFPHDSLLVAISSPSIIDGLAWHELCSGSHERLHVPCLSCGAHHWLDPDLLEPLHSDYSPDAIRREDAAAWRCPRCGHRHRSDDRDRQVALATASPGCGPSGGWVPGTWDRDRDGRGLWQPSATADAAGRLSLIAPCTSLHRSGWLNSLYSRFITLGAFLADARASAQGSAQDRQAHINGWRAEPALPEQIRTTDDSLQRVIAAAPGYVHGQTPRACARLVIACDQQGMQADHSWFPYVVRAWSADGTSDLVEAGRVDGFPGLDSLAQRQWPVGGALRHHDALSVDCANGPLQRAIRSWLARDGRRRHSIQGSGTMSPQNPYAWIDPSTPQKRLALCGLPRAWIFNHTWIADLLHAHLCGLPGYPAWRLPPDAPVFYRQSLGAEERIEQTSNLRGRIQRVGVWRLVELTDHAGRVTTRTDNHWLDAERMNLALMVMLGWYQRRPSTRPAVLGITGRNR